MFEQLWGQAVPLSAELCQNDGEAWRWQSLSAGTQVCGSLRESPSDEHTEEGRGVARSRQCDLPDVVLDPDVSERNDQETETDISQELSHITWPQKQRQILSLLQRTTGKPHASCKSKVRMPDLRKSLTLDNNWRPKVSEQLKVGRKFNFNCLVLIHRPHFLCPYWKMTFGNTHGPLNLAAAGILQIHFVFSLWINTGGNYSLSGRSRIASAIEAVNKVTDNVLGLLNHLRYLCILLVWENGMKIA